MPDKRNKWLGPTEGAIDAQGCDALGDTADAVVVDAATQLLDPRPASPIDNAEASVSSRIKCRIKALQFDAGVVGAELPVHFGLQTVPTALPCGDLGA